MMNPQSAIRDPQSVSVLSGRGDEVDLALGAERPGDWIPLGAIGHHLPRNADGRIVNKSTVWRWIRHGIDGIRLATIVVGRRRYTTRQALRAFVAARTAATEPDPTPAEVGRIRRTKRANLHYLKAEGMIA